MSEGSERLARAKTGCGIVCDPSPHGVRGLSDIYGLGDPHAPKFSDRSALTGVKAGKRRLYSHDRKNQPQAVSARTRP